MRKKVIISLGVKGYFCDWLAKNGTALPTKPDDIWPAFSRAFKATHRYMYTFGILSGAMNVCVFAIGMQK